jgi:DNA-binding winged helix-turn-helix (wHTH) protein/tetratricopeptide (TPR) repeat protein
VSANTLLDWLRMPGLRFSVFELHRESNELTRSGRRVAIPRQAFTVLWVLASAAGRVVSRDELRRALWDANTHVDFERGLNFVIATARRALADDARRPRFIETIPKHGYRFIAEVAKIETLRPPALRQVPGLRLAWAAAILLVFQAPVLLGVRTRETAAPGALAAFERGDYAEALRLDGRFAEAHYALAAHYMRLGEQGAIEQRRAFEVARAAVGRAIALEEAPESLKLLGSLRLIVDWDFEGARRDLRRAIEQAPRWDLGLSAYAEVLSATGDDAGAIAAVRQAQALSPGCSLFPHQAAHVLYRARRYDEALEQIDRARELGPPGNRTARDWNQELRYLAFRIHLLRNDLASARHESATLAALSDETADVIRQLRTMPPEAAVRAFLGRSADSARLQGRGGMPASRIALVNALAGRPDEAMAWLERAALHRDAELLSTLRDPALDALRQTPRFRMLLGSHTAGN